jgi:hypothetical protein
LNDTLLLVIKQGALTALSEYVHHRWRHRLEELYRCPLSLTEVAARRNGTWSVGRSPKRYQLGLGYPGGRQQKDPDGDDPKEGAFQFKVLAR